jgi:hypothetical protein
MPNGVMSQMEYMRNLRYLKKPHMIMVNLEASIKLTIVNVAYDLSGVQYGEGGDLNWHIRLCPNPKLI